MAEANGIRDGMQILGSDGGAIGSVIGIEGDQIALRSAGERGGHHHVPAAWVARVDEHVHLDRPAALAWDTAPMHREQAATQGRAQVRDEAAGPRKLKWLPWAVLAVLVLAGIYYLIRGLDYASRETNYQESANGVMNSPDS